MSGGTLAISASLLLKYDGSVETKDTTPLAPNVRERKVYRRGVGLVREQAKDEGSELVEVTRTRP